MDWSKATTELSKPLSRDHVKSRSQAGRQLSYIEGWVAISEANRIFGFDGWTRTTTEIKCVAERERKLKSGADAWGVSYIAKVRVMVDHVFRDGTGAGHGIDVDLGQAHESAIKEAETDAMKRALMTFGNPFGLALYDKTQANVSDEPNGNGKAHEPAAPPPPPSDAFISMRDELPHILSAQGLVMWGDTVSGLHKGGQITNFERAILAESYKVRKAEIAKAA